MMTNLSMDFPVVYHIRVQGLIDESWFSYYDNMDVEVEQGALKHPTTTLTGRVADQAALQGMLNLIYDLRLPILSVKCLLHENHDAQEINVY